MAQTLQIEPEGHWLPGKYARAVKARSLLCYWGARELGMTTVKLGKRLNLAQPTISQSVVREQKIAQDLRLRRVENNQ